MNEDDKWIIEHEIELRKEIMENCLNWNRPFPPSKGTILARACELLMLGVIGKKPLPE